jgi:hypothetical protein
MNARMTLAVGALAAVLLLAAAPRAEAGGIVYWGGTRVISTGTPVVTVPAPAAHVVGKAYEAGYQDGYQDGFSDGVRTEVGRTVVTRTIVAPTYTVPTPTVYTYTVPTVVVRRSPVVRLPCLPTMHSSRLSRSWHRVYRGHLGHRPLCRPGAGVVIRW